jgi:hypothetical protein
MTAVTNVPANVTSTTGTFRLTDDVGIRISAVTQDGYTAEFAHRKLTKVKCTLAFTTTLGSRITCIPGQTLTAANYTFQDS